jgi:hypothetical protein
MFFANPVFEALKSLFGLVRERRGLRVDVGAIPGHWILGSTLSGHFYLITTNGRVCGPRMRKTEHQNIFSQWWMDVSGRTEDGRVR